MELYPQCVSCVMDNVLKRASRMGLSERDRMRLLRRMWKGFEPEIRVDSCAPILTEIGYDLLSDMTGGLDPFKEEKEQLNRSMMAMEEDFFDLSSSCNDPLEAAMILSGTANLLDLGAYDHIDHEKVSKVMKEEVDSRRLPKELYRRFTETIEHHKEIVILGDNCGEIVLDKVVIRQMRLRWPDISVTFGVRGKAILNDATEEDGLAVGMADLAKVVSTGVGTPGFLLSRSSEDFRSTFDRSPIVLAKGVGNFEAAPFDDDRVFHLFMVKCRTLSRLLGKPEGDLIFSSGKKSLYN
nr:ARMT1-like domain-containing protein [uncultured Dethiosulfovibrio sp.]